MTGVKCFVLRSDYAVVTKVLITVYTPVEERIFKEDEWNSSLLLPLLTAGAAEMSNKLSRMKEALKSRTEAHSGALRHGTTIISSKNILLHYMY